jgi:uncharacterized protein YydD (DUF2326 family)
MHNTLIQMINYTTGKKKNILFLFLWCKKYLNFIFFVEVKVT